MTSQFQIAVLLAVVSLFHISCTRAKSDNSQIVISVADFNKATLSSCTTCLKFLAVNINGPGIPNTIYAKLEHNDFQEEGTQLAGEIVLEVPSGDGRLIEMVAVYTNTNQNITVSYGSQLTNISGSSTVVSIPLDSLGEFKGGAIVGRYLTGTNTGPTGNVSIALRPKPNMPKFTLLKTSIINGWFNFFASENFEMSYILENGKEIFSDVSLNEDFKPSDLVTNTQVARVVRPSTYYEYNNMSWNQQVGEYSDVVFGFFFADGITDASKVVCKESSVSPLSKLSSNSSGSPLLNYNPLAPVPGDVNVYGGTTSCSLDPQKFTRDTISLTHHQFNGEGNNTAQSLHGAFSLKLNASNMSKYNRNGNTFEFPTLPDLFGAGNLYDSIKLFTAANEPSSRDYLRCESSELTDMGFSEVSLTGTATIGSESISVTTASAIGNSYLIVCPTKDGFMNGMGGQYIGEISPYALITLAHGNIFDFGVVADMTSTTATLTLTNSGLQQATGINSPPLVAPITYVGGSFPGTGGTCSGVLAAGSSCTIDVEAYLSAAPANTPYPQTMTINYHDGYATKILTSTVTVTSSP